MTHLGLFEGIGGFSLAAHWAGWETVAWCEWNEFGQKVLKYHFPNAEGHGDITKTDFTRYAGKIDILTGGFPCQPYSQAGKRKGKDDERHLWPEMLRAIREVRPRYVVGENVRGLTNWNGGMVFDEVQADLEAEGYEVTPFLLPACAVNAPHRRDRIWFVAYAKSNQDNRGRQGGLYTEPAWVDVERATSNTLRNGQHGSDSEHEKQPSERRINALNDVEQVVAKNTERYGCVQREAEQEGTEIREQRHVSAGSGERVYLSEGDATNSNSGRQPGKEYRQTEPGRTAKKSIPNDWQNFPTQSPICGGDDGLPTELDGITFSKWRNESIKAYGNAIVPQVAFEIFKAINQMEKLTKHRPRP